MGRGSPANLAAIATVTQFSLVLILCVGAAANHYGRRVFGLFYVKDEWAGPLSTSWLILVLALSTLGPMLLSDQFVPTWLEYVPGLQLPTIPISMAMSLMFSLDVIGIAWLVAITGGAKASPFGPVLLSIPAFGIFLREPLGRLLIYVVAIVVLSAILLKWFRRTYSSKREDISPEAKAEALALWIVSTLCLGLTTVIGQLTAVP